MGIDLTDLIRQLVEAENKRDKSTIASLLAPTFVAITRARGEEQGREALLKEVENPKNPNVQRSVEDVATLLASETVVVLRSLVTTLDETKSPPASGKFRNIHVFENQQGNWLCVVWQVTELKQTT